MTRGPYADLPVVAGSEVSSDDGENLQPLRMPQVVFGAGGEDASPQRSWRGFPEGKPSAQGPTPTGRPGRPHPRGCRPCCRGPCTAVQAIQPPATAARRAPTGWVGRLLPVVTIPSTTPSG